MSTGLVFLESTAVTAAASAGISLSTALNVQLLCQLTVLCTCGLARLRTFTAFAILRGTATISTKARCAWDSGLAIALVMEILTPTQAGIQCPGSLLKKFQSHRLRSEGKTAISYMHL